MFARDIIQQIAAWKTDANRKPLLIHGARQVGKTWALKYFGKEYFEDVAYFSLDKDESGLCDIFQTTKDPKRIVQQLSFLHGRKINPQHSSRHLFVIGLRAIRQKWIYCFNMKTRFIP